MPFECPRYVEIAWGELDVAEVPGYMDNPKIVAYHATTAVGESHDEVSWCSSFVNAMVTRAGSVGTNSKAARSWLAWGASCEPFYGSVCVLWRVDPNGWQGHVGILVGDDVAYVYLLGGNQSNRVRVSRYPKSQVLGYRCEVALDRAA
jgi:uncharacterized protein (TIGR02594 family)